MTRLTLSWPTAIVVCVAVAAVVVTALVGPAAGLDPDTLHLVLGAEGAIGALVAGLMRQLLVPREPEPPPRAQPILAPQPPGEPPGPPPASGILGLGLMLVAVELLTGCSSGPQLPIITTPIHISCTWQTDGGTIEDSDCMIDRSSAAPATSTTGVQTETRDISPSVSVPVGLGGTTR